jgi:hypothetical protein
VLKEPCPEQVRAKPIVLPYASLGTLFKGRAAFIERVHESLTRADGGTTAIVSKALYGMGGIGKTRAAVEYAWAHRADYTALLFAQADSREELRRNLAGLCGPLQLPEFEAAEEDVRLNAVVAWLGANPGWLLTPDALAELDRLMGRLAGGHLVLTSRLDRFARQVEPLELDVLSLDAAAFLLEATDARRQGRNERNAPLICISGQIRNSGGQRRAVGGRPQWPESAMVFRRFVCRRPDITAPAPPRALSRLAAAPYDACEKRAGRVNGLAFTDLWE